MLLFFFHARMSQPHKCIMSSKPGLSPGSQSHRLQSRIVPFCGFQIWPKHGRMAAYCFLMIPLSTRSLIIAIRNVWFSSWFSHIRIWDQEKKRSNVLLEQVLAIQQSCESSGLYVCHKIPRIPPWFARARSQTRARALASIRWNLTKLYQKQIGFECEGHKFLASWTTKRRTSPSSWCSQAEVRKFELSRLLYGKMIDSKDALVEIHDLAAENWPSWSFHSYARSYAEFTVWFLWFLLFRQVTEVVGSGVEANSWGMKAACLPMLLWSSSVEAVINFFKDRGPKLLVQQEWDWWNVMAERHACGEWPLPCQDGVSLVNEEVHHFLKQQDWLQGLWAYYTYIELYGWYLVWLFIFLNQFWSTKQLLPCTWQVGSVFFKAPNVVLRRGGRDTWQTSHALLLGSDNMS